MLVRISRTADFIPEWNGNKSDANPISFTYRHPTTEERDRFIRWSTPKLESDGKGESLSRVERIIERKQMFLSLVSGISNLSVEDAGKERHITTAKEMLDVPGLNDLYDEVVAHLIQACAVVDLKN